MTATRKCGTVIYQLSRKEKKKKPGAKKAVVCRLIKSRITTLSWIYIQTNKHAKSIKDSF
jgi:hypothetical protein